MNTSITIIFAYRNRDADRIRFLLQSLAKQTKSNFEVIFVDYGSSSDFSKSIQREVALFSFVRYYYVAHDGLLWNKSKALNFGIKKTTTPFILTADIDLLFAPNTIEICETLKTPNDFFLFKVGYLSKKVTNSLSDETLFKSLKIDHIGDTFGIGLYPKKVLEEIHGFDEFFHFYGAEDEDLNSRLELLGVKQNQTDRMLFLHQWHTRYSWRKDNVLDSTPRLTKAERLNQRHHYFQQFRKLHIPICQFEWGDCYFPEDLKILSKPTKIITIINTYSNLTHFFNVELIQYQGEVLSVNFICLPYYKTLKYYFKKILGKETRDFIGMKNVNDKILEAIVFHYRNFNYDYRIAPDLKSINLTIDLRKN